jgi:dienelactone hydrolase
MARPHSFTRSTVRLPSAGEELEAHLFLPEGMQGSLPAVVLGGGWCYVKEFDSPVQVYGRAFACSGLAALAIDYRGFGGSGGKPRQHVDPWMQIDDYRAAVSYVQRRPEVDGSRVGVFGISYSGGHVLILSAIDNRVNAAVSVVPVVDGWMNLRLAHGTSSFRRLRECVEQGRRAFEQRGEHTYIPQNSADPAVVTTWPFAASEAMFDWLSAGDGGQSYENRNTVLSVEMLLNYSVHPYLDRIVDTPTLMVVAENDDHTFWDLEVEAFNRIRTPKKELRVAQTDKAHHGLYRDPQLAGDIAADCAAWFVRWL